MKKRIIAMLLTMAMTMGLAACKNTDTKDNNNSAGQESQETEETEGGQEAADPGTVSDLEPVNLVFSTQASGDVNYVKAMHMIADEISGKTNGNFTMEIHENGSLMTQEGEVDAVARGTLDMMFSSPFLISDQLPYLTMFTAAYIFKDEPHMRAVMDGEIGQQVTDDVAEKLNVRWLSALYCGARHLDLVDLGKEIKKPEDLNGVNLRMPNSSAWLFMGKALGANPTPMAYAEIYQGLQTGAIEGQENPLPTTISQKWYEVTDQIVLTGHVIEPMCIAINEEKWQSLPEEYKEILTEAIRTATLWCDEANIQQEKEAISFLKEQGLTITEPDLDAFMSYSEDYYLNDAEMTKDWDMDLYQKIKTLEY